MIDKYIETFNIFQSDIFQALSETINMMFTAMIISLIFGLLFGFIMFITGSNGIHRNKFIYFIISGITNILRSIPFILFIIVIVPFNRLILGTGFGVNASKLPLSLVGIASFARLTEQDLLDVDKGIYETAYSLGASTIQYIIYFLLKEARSGLILSFTSTTISLLSYSTVMGVIGGGGLGYLAISEGHNNFNYNLMWIIIFIMIIIVQIVQTIGNTTSRIKDKR